MIPGRTRLIDLLSGMQHQTAKLVSHEWFPELEGIIIGGGGAKVFKGLSILNY